ncbi:MAG: hypothetical protein WHS88_02195 [Anaerohalosphaeraceae bacterium]
MKLFGKKDRQNGRSGGLLSRWFGKKDAPPVRPSEKKESVWPARVKICLSWLVWILLGTGLVWSFGYLNQYVRREYPQAFQDGPLELANVPEWVESSWIDAIKAAVGSGLFALEEGSARRVWEKLTVFSWLSDVRVQAVPGRLRVEARYRKPCLQVKTASGKTIYLDEEAVVLDAPVLMSLPIVELRGLPSERLGKAGQVSRSEEAVSVLKLIEILRRMDEKCSPNKPLLNEIKAVDIANWVGGRNPSAPRIILETHDGTQVYWGAPYGKAGVFLEADETEKLSSLYNFYIRSGYTLQGKVKYLELRTPVGQRPRPR